jgi:hypothetical protein
MRDDKKNLVLIGSSRNKKEFASTVPCLACLPHRLCRARGLLWFSSAQVVAWVSVVDQLSVRIQNFVRALVGLRTPLHE